jgi:Flp pilus assembly protein TadG
MASIQRIARTTLRRLCDARGDALVEFALVAPLLFVVLFGMIDFGKAFNYWLDENHLASQAARLAAVDNTSPSGTCLDGSAPTGSPLLLSYIKCNADSSELRSNASVCVHFPAGATATTASNPVKITVSTSYTWLPIIGSLLGGAGTTTITGDATMRLENNSSLADGDCAP